MTTATQRALWRPYEDSPILTRAMARGPEHVPAKELGALRDYLDAVVSSRSAPVHVNVAFNAAYFGFDLSERGYVGGPLDLDALPVVAHGQSRDPVPVGALVALSTASSPFFAEVVYREGAHPGVDNDGSVPAWLSGAPAAFAASEQPPPAAPVAGPFSRRELLVLDFSAFTAHLAPTPAQLDRLRQRGKHLDENGHVTLEAQYAPGVDADAAEATAYQQYLMTTSRELLLSASAPLPLPTLLTDDATEEDLRAALSGMFATVAAALAGLDSVRLWGGYAFPRSSFGQRLSDDGVLGGADLGMLAAQLTSSAVGSRRSRWSPDRTVSYTAVGPLLRQVRGAGRSLHGTNYATLVAHANTVIGDCARREADPDTGLLSEGVHLRVDDTWQAGGIWRAERPGVVQPDVDVTDPLGLGWAEAAGLLKPPPAEPELPPEPASVPALDEEPPDEGQVLSVSDSQVMWTQPLRLAHQLGAYLPVPAKLAALWEGTLDPGPVKLAVHHDGFDLEPEEASQEVMVERSGDKWRLTAVTWPIEFFAGIVLLGTWQRGGRLLRVQSTLLDAPVTVDGFDIAHRYDPAVLTQEGRPAHDRDQSWEAIVLSTVRRAGLLDVQGCAVISKERLLDLVCPRQDSADQVEARAAVDSLIGAGKLTAATGGVGVDNTLAVPCPSGATPVPVVRYIPKVIVGPPRKAAVPAVLRGLMKTGGLSEHMLREIDVAGHLRRLPRGQQASAEKRAEYRQFRARYHLAGPAELPPGNTFVSPFQREV